MPEKLSRRTLLKLAGAGAISAVLGGCKKGSSTPELKPSSSSTLPLTATAEPSKTMAPIPSPTATEAPTTTLAPFPTIERSSWVVPVSNTEAKYNEEKKAWEYYGTAEGNQGQYIVSVKQNEKGEYYFHNFAEEVNVKLHSELFSDASLGSIVETMKKTGAVKFIPCLRDGVEKLKVGRYADYFNNSPVGLIIYPNHYPLRVYYPYLEGGQVNPGTSGMTLALSDINAGKIGWETCWVQVYALDDLEKPRVMVPGESLAGNGILAQPGTPIMEVKGELVELLGRGEYEDAENRMLLDSFARDSHGRLMLPTVSLK